MISLLTCVGVDTDLPLVPHFVRHYAEQGVERILVILNSNAGNAARRFGVADTRKLCLCRGGLRAVRGNHFVHAADRASAREAPSMLEIHHFKWHANVVPTLNEPIDTYRCLGIRWVDESERVIAF